jgi:uncharacterized protein (TIGR03000 family)
VACVVLAGAGLLLTPETSEAQRFGLSIGGRGGGIAIGNPYGYGGYRGYYGSPYWGGYRYGGWGYPSYYSGYRYGSWGYPSYYGYRSYSYPSYYSYSPGYYYSPGFRYTVPSYTYSYSPGYTYSPIVSGYGLGGATESYQSFYPPSGSNDNTVRVQVHVPDANAEVWFGDHRTNQDGRTREFVSPPLNSGSNYTYEVKARWMENGAPVERTRRIPVQAGQAVTVDFTQPMSGENPTSGAQGERLPTDPRPATDPAPGRPATPPEPNQPLDQKTPARPAGTPAPGTTPPVGEIGPDGRPVRPDGSRPAPDRE